MADDTAPACDTISHHVIPTERAGALNVWVQGDLSLAQNKESRDSYCTFLTVHDVGVNHNSWLRFMNSPSMAQIREKAVFLHVDLLGQEDQAEDLEKDYPSMQVRILTTSSICLRAQKFDQELEAQVVEKNDKKER